ncbi:glycosyltransferase [Derxia gummosa]|uniref:Glycosyltransferase n=1 Tax=Derxia gummosa DSM 723 TaxID=1121388 RepID=A0A8B6X2F3_9BURK|nr:glycosyltransferase [Derxia gummosa]
MTASGQLKVILVDPSLFTAPYDAALGAGLVEAGVRPTWAVRPVRRKDRRELPAAQTDDFFYRHTDEAEWIPRKLRPVAKGLAHLKGLALLFGRVLVRRPDVVHFQWTVVPPLDVIGMWLISRVCPVVLTVHDTVPFNGERMSFLQNAGFDLPIRLASRVVVHTQGGRRNLIERGVPEAKIAVIPHGPLQLPLPVPARAEASADPRWTFVLFGEIKPYKGLDLLIEAIGQLPPALRARAKVIVAGRPRMEMAPLLARIAELGLGDVFDLRLARQSEEEMALLFGAADCFVFPYRQIDASGVYFLVKSLGKWMIASRVGIFAEDLREGVEGALLPGGDVQALAEAIAHSIEQRPAPPAGSAADKWADIGQRTRALYEDALARRAGLRPAPRPQS